MPDPVMKVVFSASERSYGDSPRAIETELLNRGAGFRRQWILPEDAWAPDGVERFLPGSEEARGALEEADFIVSNTYLLQRFEKKPGATYLQTWHGTPLKRIGHNIKIPRHVLEFEVTSRDDAARWDWLVAPNAFTVPILEEEFAGIPLLETGYPRNDILLSPRAGEIRERVRAELGLAPNDRAALYAPTFRDDDLSIRFGLDPDRLEPMLDPGVVVLARSHLLTPASGPEGERNCWRDVTGWPDIAELYLAADALITDYSSAMFDFAVTRKPLLFYTYDLEHYRDESRGFYFDFENEAPGPLLRTPGEVADALNRVDAMAGDFVAEYEAFTGRFCHWDDGAASRRVVDQVFEEALSPGTV
ncbi:MAG: CDP-glycerol glycerophosphotransferase family protein [Actinomycetota bacterium]|nr:CDP-glycerol glycerophosphotransferase family protein [Actinomycetota bacterium]